VKSQDETPFQQLYQKYTNIELLRIVRYPDDYQAAAVEAATQILTSRNVSDEDREQAEQLFHNIDSKEAAKHEKIEALQAKVADVLQPLIKPGPEITPQKWLNVFLLIIAIQYIWTFYTTLQQVIDSVRYHINVFGFLTMTNIFILIYIPIIFYLLFKRRRWGWILLFADNILALMSLSTLIYNSFRYPITAGNSTAIIIQFSIRIAFVLFLWRQTLAGHFGVSEKAKLHTLIITVCVTVAFAAGLFYSW
jgi:hypothetical protein